MTVYQASYLARTLDFDVDVKAEKRHCPQGVIYNTRGSGSKGALPMLTAFPSEEDVQSNSHPACVSSQLESGHNGSRKGLLKRS
jgi:hypothetical protein